MIKISYIFYKAKDLKISDFLAAGKMIAAIAVSPAFKKKYKNTWIVCEDEKEARDNGYWFFKHVTQNHPEQKCVYAIKPKAVDYPKVSALGETVQYGSFRHWIIYLTSQFNISSQKGGKPNAALCAFMELNHLFKRQNVFLQHGVTINKARWLYADRSSFKYFITATTPETEYIEKYFGYEKGVVRNTGFSRFDNLHNLEVKKNRILIMPSWRVWFKEKSAQVDSSDANFESSEYLEKWKGLLSDEKMKALIEKYQLEIIFYPHRNMQDYLHCFSDVDSGVIIGSSREYDVQDLLKTSRLLITDYSSVFFDMIYMKKPIIFYQFDEEKFRQQQYQEGYFDYHNNAFGRSYKTSEPLLEELTGYVQNNFEVSKEYLEEHQKVFQHYDANNSERIYRLLKEEQ